MSGTNPLPPHKRNFDRCIEPEYAMAREVHPGRERERFQTFMNECMALIPDEGAPADPYMYNAHMGAFMRTLDVAKDEYVKARLAFHVARGSKEAKTDAT